MAMRKISEDHPQASLKQRIDNFVLIRESQTVGLPGFTVQARREQLFQIPGINVWKYDL
jgi:hypothetical protein